MSGNNETEVLRDLLTQAIDFHTLPMGGYVAKYPGQVYEEDMDGLKLPTWVWRSMGVLSGAADPMN